MLQKPDIVFVPGAWHPGSIFDNIRDILREKGYVTHALTLPTLCSPVDPTPLSSPEPDVVHVRKIVQDLVDQGREVMMVCHSYGALPGSNALEGLRKADIGATGGRGGVIHMLMTSAALCAKGVNLEHFFTEDPGWVKRHADGTASLTGPVNTFFNDLPVDEAEKYKSQLRLHSNCYTSLPVTYEAWNHIPTTYVLCELDNAIPLSHQERLTQLINNPRIERVNAGHTPFCSVPNDMANIIRRVSGEDI